MAKFQSKMLFTFAIIVNKHLTTTLKSVFFCFHEVTKTFSTTGPVHFFARGRMHVGERAVNEVNKEHAARAARANVTTFHMPRQGDLCFHEV